MVTEQALIGWLCMYVIQEGELNIPAEVAAGIEAKKWVLVQDEDWDGTHQSVALSDAGKHVFDLNAADWGIDPLDFVLVEEE